MNKSSQRIFISAMAAALVAIIALFGIPFEPARGAPPPPEPTPATRPLPPNEPARGMIYEGLEYGDAQKCDGAFRTKDRNTCTHGPDPAPLGVDIRMSAAPVTVGNAPAAVAAQCDGDGTTGNRTQVMYVHGSDVVDRYSTFLGSIQTWAASADTIYQSSAAETGGYRRLRFVHNASCAIIVLDVGIPGTGHIDFNTMESQLVALGYSRSDRKYMIFMDDTLYCGIGNLYNHDIFAQSNYNNSGPSYARADSGCWSGSTIAHESMHNMGAVQHSAPHSTYLQVQNNGNTWHCSDEWDRMCYSDAPGVVMTTVCTNSSHENLFDCNHDDYYSTNPAPGSYLATKWNSANNRFLITTMPIPLTPRVFLPLVIK